jgi:hypothetical protein
MINFHLDNSAKTLQMSINDEDEYIGGRLLFLNKGRL